MKPSQTILVGRSIGSTLQSIKSVAALLLGVAMTSAVAVAADNRAPEVPATIAVPEGHKVHFHGFALGVQIYTWNGTNWGASVPEAVLFDNDGNVVATHFGGPTWESNSGSQVVGALPPLAVVVDPTAIPWLRLATVSDRTHGPGIFANTTYIHRVNTVGGKAPSDAGTFVGQVTRVPYAADYYFYRAANH
ncbi:MAG TPA: DUF3455 domain-containing protein [Verrucomicrobiae bacterium]|nr:DUF3455 domain-containing protein [Verrucomicrobiae bacterium]